ncbi:enoyl-CoA hydratase-related protein, partial [Acinetobacter baumannii]
MSDGRAEVFETILVEKVSPDVVRIALNRPESRNAQNAAMLYELNTAFNEAARDDAVKVIILAAQGKHFSSG